MLPKEKLPSQVWEFSVENCPNGSLAKVTKFHTNPYNFVACLPNPYKLSILGDIWRAIILPFSSSKYFYSCLRLSNLVDLSFEYLSFSNKPKTTILFPSPLTFLQWVMSSPSFIFNRSSDNLLAFIFESLYLGKKGNGRKVSWLRTNTKSWTITGEVRSQTQHANLLNIVP